MPDSPTPDAKSANAPEQLRTFFSPHGTEWEAESYEEALEMERDYLATALSECRNALVRVLGWPLPQATVEDALPPWLSKQARDAAQPPSEAAKGMPPAQGNCPAPTESNLPERIVVGANGAYWRYFEPDGVGTTEPFYSMCPVSSDNDPVEPVAVYVRQPPSEAKGEWNTRRYGWNPVSKADVMPCSSQGRSGDAESASETVAAQPPSEAGTVDADGTEHCGKCGLTYYGLLGESFWSAPNELWNEVEGNEGGLRCPRCFVEDARALGIHVSWRAVEYSRAAQPPSEASERVASQPKETM